MDMDPEKTKIMEEVVWKVRLAAQEAAAKVGLKPEDLPAIYAGCIAADIGVIHTLSNFLGFPNCKTVARELLAAVFYTISRTLSANGVMNVSVKEFHYDTNAPGSRTTH